MSAFDLLWNALGLLVAAGALGVACWIGAEAVEWALESLDE